MKRNEHLRDLWNNIKCTNIPLIGVSEETGPEKTFEKIIVKKFPNMDKEIVTQVQEVQRVPYRINPRKTCQDMY